LGAPVHAFHRNTTRSTPVIVVLDDAEAVRVEACRILRAAGYVAVPVRGGVEAPWLAYGAAGVDLLISDVSMRECDSYHGGLPLRALQERVPVLYLSPWGHAETVRMGLLHPYAPFLQKPFPPGALTRAVGRLLAQQRIAREPA
jgi:DNA-binding NtrC family response regulator